MAAGEGVRWSLRSEPLVPCACVARGALAQALGRELLAWEPGRLARIKACAGEGMLVVLGASADLPWLDGVVYLGRDEAAPHLLLPTNRVPDVPVDLFARALAARIPAATKAGAVLPDAGRRAALDPDHSRGARRARVARGLDGRSVTPLPRSIARWADELAVLSQEAASAHRSVVPDPRALARARFRCPRAGRWRAGRIFRLEPARALRAVDRDGVGIARPRARRVRAPCGRGGASLQRARARGNVGAGRVVALFDAGPWQLGAAAARAPGVAADPGASRA